MANKIVLKRSSVLLDGDSNYSNVSLLMHMDGANGSTTFTDTSPTPKTVTPSGNAQISTAQSKFGGASAYFDGNADYLSIPSSQAFEFAGDFTIECFAYVISAGTGDKNIFVTGVSGGVSFGLVNGKFQIGANSIAYDVTSTNNVPTGQWVHLAACRSGSTMRLFIDGTQDGSATITRTYVANGTHSIGGSSAGAAFSLNGYIDELRITKGVARYTANFTPPTAAFPDSLPSAKAPVAADLEYGELALNYSGGRLYYKKADNSIDYFVAGMAIGYTGSQGPTGAQGTTGFTGSRGATGFTGSQGSPGIQGYTGSQGPQGAIGPQGIQGYTGSQGSQGLIGYTGSQGIQGVIGYTGSQGPIGYTGSQGPQGTTGFTGSKGDQGVIGYTGSQGPIGYTGSQGTQGVIGYTGSQGAQGTTGFTGSQGTQGVIGYTGSQGPQGVIGYTGSQGTQGVIGYTGSQGIQGTQGPIGYTGSQGPQGVIGYTGSQGPQGVIGYTGSQGIQGTTGFTGSKGDQGVIGYTGSQGAQGTTGFTGSQGTQGVIGYTGSKGDQGVIGYTGSQGTQGVIGYTGSQGVIGYTGSQGSQGVIGYTGSKGDQGTTGFTGSQGTQGIIGYTGSQGAQGAIGYTGSQGTQGVTGYTGSQGAIGYTGSRGLAVTLTAGTGLSGGGLLDQDRTISLDTTYTDGRYVNTSGDTLTGFLTLHADPTANLHAASKQYVDTVASASINYHSPVRVESPTALNATYNNGTDGVGATLTNAGTQAAIVIDGVALSVNDRVLVYTQANAAHNGVYYVSNVGSASTNWVLTRTTDADSYGLADPNSLGTGDAFYVKEGTTGAGELYVMVTPGVITFGTTSITFNQISSAQIYSAGAGLTLTGTQFAHADTSSVANLLSDNSGQTVLQDISFTFDTYGHVTAASVATTTIPTINDGTLTLGVSGSGLSGSATFTANQSGASTFTVTSNATAANTASTIVFRDASGNFAAGQITANALVIDSTLRDYATTTTTATTQVALVSFAAASYGSGEVMIQATQGTARHTTKLLVAHDGTTAIATEYGRLLTGASLYSVEVDISGGNVRVLITPASATSTVFRATYTLIGA